MLNTNQANPVPGDPTGDLAVAANARLALYSGGDYLLRRLTAEPATPASCAMPSARSPTLYKSLQ